MDKSKIIIWGVSILAIAGILYLILRKPESDTIPEPKPGGNGGTTPTPNGGVPPTPSLSDFLGKQMVAPYDGTKIYYNYDLTEAKSFGKGEAMGWLGEEETGNWVCPNRSGYYKVWDSGLDAKCDLIISEPTAKLIFGLK